jgi:1-acyl-sn-glycerol-3-phosphate acyltransferase
MLTLSQQTPKPRSEVSAPEIVGLPEKTVGRQLFRIGVEWILRGLIWSFTRTRVSGIEHFPEGGPALIVTNHLGDADVVLGMAYFPAWVDALAKVELYSYPIVGKLMDMYGVIWVHRGQPDRKAIREALTGLKNGRFIAIAPEGRESVSGSLERGTGGAAYLALKSGAPIVPITFTGTENQRIIGNLRRLRRSQITLTVGPAFHLSSPPEMKLREAVQRGTHDIMRALARQLPPQYRGIYRNEGE